jgi:hypothetical protein
MRRSDEEHEDEAADQAAEDSFRHQQHRRLMQLPPGHPDEPPEHPED